MRRLLINILAIIGGLVVIGVIPGIVLRAIAGKNTGVVWGPDNKPFPHVSVFLDRGSSAIERYVTDSAGRFAFALEPAELRRATWLICAPGGIPMVGRREDDSQIGPTTYQYTRLTESTWGSYRAWGWRGPIPRECPTGTDSMGWRYPASSGKSKYAFTTTEPVWPR